MPAKRNRIAAQMQIHDTSPKRWAEDEVHGGAEGSCGEIDEVQILLAEGAAGSEVESLRWLLQIHDLQKILRGEEGPDRTAEQIESQSQGSEITQNLQGTDGVFRPDIRIDNIEKTREEIQSMEGAPT